MSAIKERERQELKGYREMGMLNRELSEEINDVTNEVWPEHDYSS